MRGAVIRTAEPAPWWASPWAQRLTEPREAVLIPLLVTIVLAWLAGRWLRRSAARDTRDGAGSRPRPATSEPDGDETGPRVP